jgi:hypothetical protein
MFDNNPSGRGLEGKTLIIFGGYGGDAFARKDFNDLYSLDLASISSEDDGTGMALWEKLEPEGDETSENPQPRPRCGHGAFIVHGCLYIHGGWSSNSQFLDMYKLPLHDAARDGDNRTGEFRWEEIKLLESLPKEVAEGAQDHPHLNPRWGHRTLVCDALPVPKVFFIFGQSGNLNETSMDHIQGRLPR